MEIDAGRHTTSELDDDWEDGSAAPNAPPFSGFRVGHDGFLQSSLMNKIPDAISEHLQAQSCHWITNERKQVKEDPMPTFTWERYLSRKIFFSSSDQGRTVASYSKSATGSSTLALSDGNMLYLRDRSSSFWSGQLRHCRTSCVGRGTQEGLIPGRLTSPSYSWNISTQMH